MFHRVSAAFIDTGRESTWIWDAPFWRACI